MADLSQLSLGFLGCGKISSAVCRGYASATGINKPLRLLVSLRSEEKSKALKEEFPDLVTICSSSEELVSLSDVIFIGLLPKVAREVLPTLSFENKLVVSMMAAVDFSEVVSLTRPTENRVVRTVPLPSAARRTGPILMYPPNDEAEQLLKVVGTPVVCRDEQAMKPLVAVTGHISSFFELMRLTQDWAVDRGE
jgi:pyrroline-5-carboxylate reductase